MSKREKIIVSLMIGSVIFGAYHFLSLPVPKIPFKTPGRKSDHKEEQKPVVSSLSEKEQYILRQAAVPWTDDPFILYKPNARKTKAYPPIPKDLKYSGYLKTENRILAIINGAEYQIGETLLQTPYLVADISPKRVTIALPGGINPGDIPISESDEVHENKK
jgi:hypothetical protein